MAGLGLMNALHSYQQGVQWHEQQQQLERQRAAQARIDAGNKAATDVISASKAEWALNGAEGDYTPNDETMMRAAEARGKAFASAGDWDNFLKNEAAVQAQRVQVRGKALEQYGLDGDPERLMRSVYPTIFDGKRIKSVTKVGGATGLSDGGDPPAPPMLQFELDDGTRGSVAPDDLARRVKHSLIDPQRMAAMEIQTNLQQALLDARIKGMLQTISARGDQERTTEGLKQENKVDFEEILQDNRLRLADANNGARDDRAAADRASRERIAAGHDQTRRDTAGAPGGRGGAGGPDTSWRADAAARADKIKALREDRMAANALLKSLTSRMQAGGVVGKPARDALNKEIEAATADVRRVNKLISDLSSAPDPAPPQRGLGTPPASAAPGLSQATSPAKAGVQTAIPEPGKRVVGQTYQTPRGPLVWRGNGWSVN